MGVKYAWLSFGFLALAGCTSGEPEDTAVELPPEDTFVDDDTGLGSFPVDTSLDTDINEEPANKVTIRQWGEWNLGPFQGPYDTLLGTLEVEEYIDGEIPDPLIVDPQDPLYIELECDLEYSMAGIPVETAADECAGCTGLTFLVTYALVSGDPSLCHDHDLPADGEQIVFGFKDADQQIYMNFQNADLWVPWYDAEKIGDQVTYDWQVTLGIALEDEEEE